MKIAWGLYVELGTVSCETSMIKYILGYVIIYETNMTQYSMHWVTLWNEHETVYIGLGTIVCKTSLRQYKLD